ncbi:MAG: hypothetical protein LBH91_03480 [Prevotellaceae bacterium]|jgi:hypothetical protein|nr:hypothetical protein [Prevotellaceae bacterium]
MKIFYTLLSLLIFHAGLAQTANQTIAYTKNLKTYVGTWEYTSGADTFQIVVKKGILSTSNNYSECLIGGYRYVKDGILMGDYTQEIPNQFLKKDFSKNDSTITVMLSNARYRLDLVNPNILYVLFKDMGLGKIDSDCRVELLSPIQIRWTLEAGEGVYATLEEMPPEGFSVPTDIIMNKVIPPPPSPLPPLPPPGPGGGDNDELLPPL